MYDFSLAVYMCFWTKILRVKKAKEKEKKIKYKKKIQDSKRGEALPHNGAAAAGCVRTTTTKSCGQQRRKHAMQR